MRIALKALIACLEFQLKADSKGVLVPKLRRITGVLVECYSTQIAILSKTRGAKEEKKKSAVFKKWGSQFWHQNTFRICF
jgi:hypothetical protein